MSNSGNFIGGVLVGGLVGFVSGMLWAPKTGSEMRKQLAETSDDLCHQANTQFADLKHQTENALGDMQTTGQKILRKASDTVVGTTETLKTRLDDMTGQGSRPLVEDLE